MAIIKDIAPNRKYPRRLTINDDIRVLVTAHAVRRCTERGIDLVALLHTVAGVHYAHYREYGLVAKWHGKARTLTVITVYKRTLTAARDARLRNPKKRK